MIKVVYMVSIRQLEKWPDGFYGIYLKLRSFVFDICFLGAEMMRVAVAGMLLVTIACVAVNETVNADQPLWIEGIPGSSLWEANRFLFL